MQFKVLYAMVFSASLAAATATGGIPASQCNTAPVQCCQSTGTAQDPAIANLLKGLNINVQDVTALVGVTCTPITAIGTGGGTCSAAPVCCENNTYNGVIAIGCVPVTL